MRLISSWDNSVKTTIESSPDFYGNREFIFNALPMTQWLDFLLALGLPVKINFEREKNACYQVVSGFFNNTLILISSHEPHLKITFKVVNHEQGDILQKLSAGIEKRLSSGLQSCKVEVIFENRRL